MPADALRSLRHWLLLLVWFLLAVLLGGCQVVAPSSVPAPEGLPARGQEAAQPAPVEQIPTPLPASPSQEPQQAPSPSPPPASTPEPGATVGGPTGPGANLFDAHVGQAPIRAAYSALWIPDQPVAGQRTNLGVLREDLTLGSPLWQSTNDEWTLNGTLRSELFHTGGTVLPNTGQPFPDELWDVRLGTSYRHLFDNGWIAGGTVNVGSASDKPFHSIDEMTVGVNAFLRVPQGEHNAWLFSLSYSPTAQLPFPIPSAAFVYQPSEYFRANIGLPFQLMYRPIDDLTLDFSYMLLTNIHAQATYRLAAPLRLHAGFDWTNESYFLAERTDTQDRFFSYEKRLSVGVQYNLCRNASLDLTGGYVFDRFYFEGHQLSDSDQNRVDVGDSAFLSLRLQSRW